MFHQAILVIWLKVFGLVQFDNRSWSSTYGAHFQSCFFGAVFEQAFQRKYLSGELNNNSILPAWLFMLDPFLVDE